MENIRRNPYNPTSFKDSAYALHNLHGRRTAALARPIGWAQTAVTLILIACMGYRLGSRPDFINELSSMGLMSLLYCIVPSVFSIALVYVVTRFLLKEKKNGRNRDSW